MKDPDQIEHAFEYLIYAQSRIRICHMILLLSALYSTTLTWDYLFKYVDIWSDIPCSFDELCQSDSPSKWYEQISKLNVCTLSNPMTLDYFEDGTTYEDSIWCMIYGSGCSFTNFLISAKTYYH